MKCTDHPFLLVGDEQHADPALFHHADRFGGKRLGADRDRRGCHGLIDAERLDIRATFEHAPQVAVGEDACEGAVAALDCGHTHALAGDFENGLDQRSTRCHAR